MLAFIGWYTNSDLKNGKIDKLTVDNIGNIKLYARWSDSTIHFDTFNIHYELDRWYIRRRCTYFIC
ncbi:MAG: hypothetical protein ACLU5J_00960 [Christensenellales bacterium]